MKLIFDAALVLTLVLASVLPVAAIDFTPRPATFFGQEDARRFYFLDNDVRYVFRMDSEMEVAGERREARFAFRNVASARCYLSTSPEKAPFEGRGLDRCRALAASYLPGGVVKVAMEEVSNPIRINEWTSYQWVYTYLLGGISYRLSITLLDTDFGRIVFRVGAQSSDYESIYRRCFRVLNSMTTLQAIEELGDQGT